MKCRCCERVSELRYGVCFDCVNFESLIHEKLDMHDKPMEKLEGFENDSASLNILRAIIEYARKRK